MFNVLAQEVGSSWGWIVPVLGAVTTIGIVAVVVSKLRKALVEVKELVVAVIDLSTPGGVTLEKINAVIKEAKDVPLAFRELIASVQKDDGPDKERK